MQDIIITRSISVNETMRIHPTECFTGIPRGIIKVLKIIPVGSTDPMCSNVAEELAGDNGDEGYTKAEMLSGQWVEYKYTSWLCASHNDHELEESYYLPLDMFAGHTTWY